MQIPTQDLSITNSDFKKDLTSLLNTYCKENESNSPDFILAEYLLSCLNAFNIASNKKDEWHGLQDPFL